MDNELHEAANRNTGRRGKQPTAKQIQNRQNLVMHRLMADDPAKIRRENEVPRPKQFRDPADFLKGKK